MSETTPQQADERTVALVTGANKGIGYEIAKGLGQLGWSVGIGARDDTRRETAVEQLRTEGVDAFGVPLDVTDDASVAAAAELIRTRGGRLDVLVNNAGITGGMPQEPTVLDPAMMRTVVETNVIGVLRVTNAMLPMLRHSASPRVVNMSSGVGSLTRQSASDDTNLTGPVAGAYSPSKTFLNALTVQYAKELRGTGVLINAACPGFVATDLNVTVASGRPSRAPPSPSGWRRCPTTGPAAATSRTPGRSPGSGPLLTGSWRRVQPSFGRARSTMVRVSTPVGSVP